MNQVKHSRLQKESARPLPTTGTSRVGIVMPKDLHREAKAQAARAGLTLSEYFVSLVPKAAEKVA
jgi:hypothetical protein